MPADVTVRGSRSQNQVSVSCRRLRPMLKLPLAPTRLRCRGGLPYPAKQPDTLNLAEVLLPEVAQGAGQVCLGALGEHACQLALSIQISHVRKPLVVQHLLVPARAPCLPARRTQPPSVRLRPNLLARSLDPTTALMSAGVDGPCFASQTCPSALCLPAHSLMARCM